MKKKLNAFTLTELLISILVIALLTVASMSIVGGHVNKSKLSKEQINKLYGCDWQVVCANDEKIQAKTGAKPCIEYPYHFDLEHKYWVIRKDASGISTGELMSHIYVAEGANDPNFVPKKWHGSNGQDLFYDVNNKSTAMDNAQKNYLYRSKMSDIYNGVVGGWNIENGINLSGHNSEIVAIYQHDLFCNFNRLPINEIEIKPYNVVETTCDIICDGDKTYKCRTFKHESDVADEQIILLVDISGSISDEQYAEMKKNLKQILSKLPAKTKLGLRFTPDSTTFRENSELIIAPEANNASKVLEALNNFDYVADPNNRQHLSPLADALEETLKNDFKNFIGVNHVIFITDGDVTKNKNGEAKSANKLVKEIVGDRTDIVVDVIGVGIEDIQNEQNRNIARKTMNNVVNVANGTFNEVTNANDLKNALNATFSICDSEIFDETCNNMCTCKKRCDKDSNACDSETEQCTNGCCEDAKNQCGDLIPCVDGQCNTGYTCNANGCCEGNTCTPCQNDSQCGHGQKCGSDGCCENCVTCENSYVDCAVILIDNSKSTIAPFSNSNTIDSLKTYIKSRNDLYLGIDFWNKQGSLNSIKVARNNTQNIIDRLSNYEHYSGSSFITHVEQYWMNNSEMFMPSDGSVCKRKHLIVITDSGVVMRDKPCHDNYTHKECLRMYPRDEYSLDVYIIGTKTPPTKIKEWINNYGTWQDRLQDDDILDKIKESLGGKCINTCPISTNTCGDLTACENGQCASGYTCNANGCCEAVNNTCGDLTPCDNGQCKDGYICNDQGCCEEAYGKQSMAIDVCGSLTPCNYGRCDTGYTCNKKGCCEKSTVFQCPTKQCTSKADCDHGQKCNAKGCCEDCVICQNNYVDCAIILLDNGGSMATFTKTARDKIKALIDGRTDLYIGVDFYQSGQKFVGNKKHPNYASGKSGACPDAIAVAKNNADNIMNRIPTSGKGCAATGSGFYNVKDFWNTSYRNALFQPADGTTCRRQHLIVLSDRSSLGDGGGSNYSTTYTAANGYTVDFIIVGKENANINTNRKNNINWIQDTMGGQVIDAMNATPDALNTIIKDSLGGTCKNTCDDD